jgi:purine-binding chemotaxis protein CheW
MDLKSTPKSHLAGSSQAGDLARLAGKYLTFRLGNEEYGLEILKVREIIGLMCVTPVPRAPDDIRGVINLRGKIIPVIDLRRKFLMPASPDTDRTCIIVVNVTASGESVDMGILVDSVSEVLDIAGSDIGPAPSFGAALDTDFILAMAKRGASVTILLAIEKVLTDLEVALATGGLEQQREELCAV